MRNLFKSKSPSDRTSHHSMRSAERLASPAFAPPDPNIPNADSNRRFSQFEYSAPGLVQKQPQTLYRSQSQRQKPLRDRPTVNVVAPVDSYRKKGRVERSVSVKGKPISFPISQPTSPGLFNSKTLKESDEFLPHPRNSYAENSPETPRSLTYQQAYRTSRPSHPAHAQSNLERSQQPVQPLEIQLQRSTADPIRLEPYVGLSPTDIVPESPRYAAQRLHRGQAFPLAQDPILNTWPLFQQTLEPLSPLQSVYPDAMQSSAQASLNQGQFQPLDRQKSAGSPQQSRSRQGSESTKMPDPGPNAPYREDSGEVDLRALIQKHDELQAKYSKVKRYYFEKDAQVQHLQNTVAHQRMAVSRTVLDDNEYASRFQRLDGAIKDLAFSVRKFWHSIPSWLRGMVTDDALSVGTKEMTAVGRAVISRWLVEEAFQRYFHPSLDSTFSVQLKNIEMNLRRQRPSSEEDRENASARLSYWRRTTFDGLNDSLVGPDAQKNRAGLVEHLIVELAAFLGSQLHEIASAGLEASVRMIIENSVNIIEKIPLEARDVCVDYFPPGVSLVEQYMKVEGQLPALSHPPPPPSDQDHFEEPAAAEGDGPSGSTAGGMESASPAQKKPSKKSIFGGLIGRKHASTEISRPAQAPGPAEDKSDPAELAPSSPRIRFASFLAVEVRGKGPATVLIKSPVWLVE
ncbi:Serine carboxypeptidase family protein [Penicillium digitatum]|uniref:Serine carboxypeptidase family protein n=1 Tax=Penicillium digitatum TaxID=36651 RepID=A0A7T6XS63_PENDI|nr:Serine carboxypeptidase family protein [Penicillium digitatum]